MEGTNIRTTHPFRKVSEGEKYLILFIGSLSHIFLLFPVSLLALYTLACTLLS